MTVRRFGVWAVAVAVFVAGCRDAMHHVSTATPVTDHAPTATTAPTAPTAAPGPTPTAGPKLLPFASRVQPLTFAADDGVQLAGQIDWPLTATRPPLIVILHHAGREPRDSYQHYAARLVPAGFAVFRFDKRGAGQSAGAYGCCEAADALAAYRAAVAQPGYDPDRVFIIAQSLGTRLLAEQFADFARAQPIAGVALLSSLLEGEAVLAIRAPVHIIVADSEPALDRIGPAAAAAHAAAYDFGASLYIATGAEHTLYDITAGPIDWGDPNWPDRFHAGAWTSLQEWLMAQAGP